MNNPYQAPRANLHAKHLGEEIIPEEAVKYIVKAGFWAKISSIVFMISTIITTLGILFAFLGILINNFSASAFLLACLILIIGAIPIVLFYLFYRYLKHYANAAKQLKNDPSIEHLTTCTNNSTSFVKLYSILTIFFIILGIMVPVIVAISLGR